MKTLFVLLFIVVVAACAAAALTPDFAIQSEVWELVNGTWDVRPCAHVIYFAGPVALEDRSDCGLPWADVARLDWPPGEGKDWPHARCRGMACGVWWE